MKALIGLFRPLATAAKVSGALAESVASGAPAKDILFYAVWQGTAVILTGLVFTTSLTLFVMWLLIAGWTGTYGQLAHAFWLLVSGYLWLGDFVAFASFVPWTKDKSLVRETIVAVRTEMKKPTSKQE